MSYFSLLKFMGVGYKMRRHLPSVQWITLGCILQHEVLVTVVNQRSRLGRFVKVGRVGRVP